MAYHHPGPGSASGSASSSGSGFHMMNSTFGDTTYTKVFVGGLAWETKSEMLRQHFEQYGEILEAVVITDKNTGRSKGYGFVTFREPESARKACVDPTPMIDGRRANCNLASQGRPVPAISFGRPRSAGPYMSGVPVPRGFYIGGSNYQRPIPLAYQQGYPYSQYGYTTYGAEYIYPQNMYTNPYMGQQYVQIYGVPNSGSTGGGYQQQYQYGQMNQAMMSGGGPGFPAVQGGGGYTVQPAHHHQLLQFGGLTTMNGGNNPPTPRPPSLHTPFLLAPVPTHPAQMIISTHAPQFAAAQGNGSDHATTG